MVVSIDKGVLTMFLTYQSFKELDNTLNFSESENIYNNIILSYDRKDKKLQELWDNYVIRSFEYVESRNTKKPNYDDDRRNEIYYREKSTAEYQLIMAFSIFTSYMRSKRCNMDWYKSFNPSEFGREPDSTLVYGFSCYICYIYALNNIPRRKGFW